MRKRRSRFNLFNPENGWSWLLTLARHAKNTGAMVLMILWSVTADLCFACIHAPTRWRHSRAYTGARRRCWLQFHYTATGVAVNMFFLKLTYSTFKAYSLKYVNLQIIIYIHSIYRYRLIISCSYWTNKSDVTLQLLSTLLFPQNMFYSHSSNYLDEYFLLLLE